MYNLQQVHNDVGKEQTQEKSNRILYKKRKVCKLAKIKIATATTAKLSYSLADPEITER